MVKPWRAMLPSVALWLALAGARHPLHTTITEIRYAEATRAATLTVRAFEDDLDAAAGREDPSVLAYVARAVSLADRAGRPLTVRWEQVHRAEGLVWIRGTAHVPSDLEDVRVRHTMLTERHADQVNVVQATAGSRRRTLLFTRGDGWKALH